MRVLVFGCSGLQKKSGLDRLANHCRLRTPGRKVVVADVGQFLRREPISTFLVRNLRAQQDTMVSAIADLTRHVEQANADVAFISLHGTYLCAGNISAPLSAQQLAGLKPDAVLTLIDDVYAAQHRLAQGGYNFLYSQLLYWRAVESLIADNFAASLSFSSGRQIPSLLLAVKHPVDTFYRLLFEPSAPRVYTSFHITRTRSVATAVREINGFRRRAHKEFAVFDPLTIDDRLLVNYLAPGLRKSSVALPNSVRWDCRLVRGPNRPLSPLVPDDPRVFPLRVSLAESRMLSLGSAPQKSIIDSQITWRDFRYIDQSDCVAVFRPWWNGAASIGVDAEIAYAQQNGKPVVVYNPSSDARKYKGRASTPLRSEPVGAVLDQLEKFYQELLSTARTRANERRT